MLASLAPAASATGATGSARAILEGTFELEISEDVDAGGHMANPRYEHFVRDEHGQQTRVTFPGRGEPPAGVAPGAKVRISGDRTPKGLAATGGVEVLADAGSTGSTGTQADGPTADIAAPTVTKRLAVILVNFASNPVQPYTAAYANAVFFTNTNSVANFFVEDSYGKLALTGDVSGWFTIEYDTGTCDTSAIQSRADAAATAAGVVLSGYQHISYVFPHLPACSFAGRAQIPGMRSWINTIANATPKLHEWVISHELGHNFGVHHANIYSCTTGGVRASLSRTASECTATEYGDPHSVMGAWNPPARFPHVDSWHRLQMGFLPASERQDVTVSGLYVVGATTFAASAPKSLRIRRTGSTGSRPWFDIEFRQPGGLWDGFSSTAPVVNGVTIRLVADDSQRVQSWLVDTTPATTSFVDAPLVVGQTLTDPLSGIAITTVGLVTDAAGNRAAKVKVVFPNTAAPAAPADFTATSSSDGLTASLSWDPAATAVGVASYRVYRDEVLVATVEGSATSFTDPGRSPGAAYAYRIEAIDWVDLVGASATTALVMSVPEIGTTTAWFGEQATSASTSTTAYDSVTRASTVTFPLHFSAPVTHVTAGKLALSGSATGCAVTGVSGAGADYTVSVSGCSEGTVAASIVAGTVQDNLGYLAPAADATSETVLIDRTAPATVKPGARLREGARLSGSAIPVRLILGGTDAGAGVASYDVARSINGGAWVIVKTATTLTSFDTTLSPGRSYRFRVRTRDAAGNVSPWVEGSVLRPALTQQSSSAIRYRGTWYSARHTGYSGSYVRYTRSSAASATYAFKGRGIALVTTVAPGRGKVKVYIDGVHVRTVDLYRSSTSYRVLAFSHWFSWYGTHTIKLVGLGTSGRPRVDLDAFAVIR
jgi:hypothetical protein